MGHNINLNNYPIRTDLVLEQIENTNNNIEKITTNENDIKVTKINIDKSNEKSLGKKRGFYITIEFDDITDFDNKEQIEQVLEKEIKELLKLTNITEDMKGLIIGLGNAESTPDALGPKVINNILVTRHLFLLDTPKEGIRNISALSPGVMGNTGIETYDIISSVIKKIKPDFLIIIDSLAAYSIDRINKTIQLTDTGINPGSGIGNNRMELSSKTLGLPVIAIGVPTVVESTTIVNDTLNYLFKHISYIKNNQSKNKLITTRFNYLDKLKEEQLSLNEQKELIGLIGTLNDNDKRSLINEVLTGINYNLIVTPKEIDFVINKLSVLIASSLNNALHKEVTHY